MTSSIYRMAFFLRLKVCVDVSMHAGKPNKNIPITNTTNKTFFGAHMLEY